MYGAVLWSDRAKGRALIWCEDHGNLAFFDGGSEGLAEASNFAEGDLVRLKVRDGRGMRLAYEVEVVSGDEYPCLAEGLREAAQAAQPPKAVPEQADRKIVPFNRDAAPAPRHHTAFAERVRKTFAV